jgi:molybdate transport system substrate-binding protein
VATPTITGISSMAMRKLLAELAAAWAASSGTQVAIESAGGVDTARRVRGGEVFDVVVLAADAIDELIAGGHIAAGSRVDLVRSKVGLAIRAGAVRPAIDSEAAVERTVRGARTIGYSTGPSGSHLERLLARWGIFAETKPRLVQAPPGVPVASLLARGEAEIGFQQLSELLETDGVEAVGTLPPPIEHVTVFSAGIGAGTLNADPAREMLAFMASPMAADAKQRHGMEPA